MRFNEMSTKQVALLYELRNETTFGICYCKKALERNDWDKEKARALINSRAFNYFLS